MVWISLYFHFSVVFFFKQKTAYEMRISDWSSDVCSSDLGGLRLLAKDCMLPTTEVVHLDQSLIDAANRLRLFSLPVLPVVDGDEIVGLLTIEAVEARQRLSPEDLAETAVRDHMSAEVAFCRTDESMETVRAIRSEEHTS